MKTLYHRFKEPSEVNLEELVPVYGAFGIFSHWETRGVNIVKKLLPLAIALSILSGMWQLIKQGVK